MRRHTVALLGGLLALSPPLGSVAAQETPSRPLARSLEDLVKLCEAKGGVRADAFERVLKSPERKSAGWVVTLQAADPTVRLAHAKQLAEAVNKVVYPVSAASLVGAYIGETEKNLELLFERAERAGWVLFFDEADALFGKRTEVKDSSDRYASDAAATLPVRLRAYSGIVVLGARSTTPLAPEVTKALVDAVVTTPTKKGEAVPALSWRAVCKKLAAAEPREAKK